MALTDKLSAIGDAIRAKTGKEEKLTLDQMPGEISGISGGSDPVLQEKTATKNGEVYPDEGYDGLSKVTVDVQTRPLTIYKGDYLVLQEAE